MKNERFSVLTYVHKRREDRVKLKAAAVIPAFVEQNNENETFRQWVEEIRSELVTARGRNEEEKQRYNETLNRAVLGYEEDRGTLLAIIHDLVSKKRLNDLPPGNRNYTTLSRSHICRNYWVKRIRISVKNQGKALKKFK